MSADQAICKIGSAVLPGVQRFLDRGLALEFRGVDQSPLLAAADDEASNPVAISLPNARPRLNEMPRWDSARPTQTYPWSAQMLKLTIPQLLQQEFATVEALWQSKGETRRVDSLILSWVKYEKQLRRLFSFLVYQHPKFTETNITSVIEAFAKNGALFPGTFIEAIKALGVQPVSALVGQRHAALSAEIARIKRYRNKLIHGQVTGQSIQSLQLERDVLFLIQWIADLADGANTEFGYDGLRRNTYKSAKSSANIMVAAFPFATPTEFRTWLGGLPKGS